MSAFDQLVQGYEDLALEKKVLTDGTKLFLITWQDPPELDSKQRYQLRLYDGHSLDAFPLAPYDEHVDEVITVPKLRELYGLIRSKQDFTDLHYFILYRELSREELVETLESRMQKMRNSK